MITFSSAGPLNCSLVLVTADGAECGYRWVVELFGFDPELPLAKDMQAKGVKAIVMEVRFSQVDDFPISSVRSSGSLY